MKKIAVFTTSRAEYGILRPLIKELDCYVFAGGGHFKTGMVECTESFDFFLNEDTPHSLCTSLGIEHIELADIFNDYDFDMTCVLGDRYELLPIVTTSTLFGVPIVHIHGGETTYGAIDNQVRNMITKASHVHFTSCEEYKKNVEALGEKNVYNVGALSVDAIKGARKIPKEKLFNDLGLDKDRDTILLVYHPSALEQESWHHMDSILSWFDFQIVSIAPGMDVGRDAIVKSLKGYCFFESFTSDRYFSLLPHCKLIIGNSSSGVIEAPYFKVPTVNIGDRQKGRVRHKSVIDTDYSTVNITTAISKAMSRKFGESLQTLKYKFGNGGTAKKIVQVLESIEINEKFVRKE